jgi:2-keto-4-pentenoate hydratase/2-oxohepta-3-ene-1,7-dioic acid hydratase in catechol pathway
MKLCRFRAKGTADNQGESRYGMFRDERVYEVALLFEARAGEGRSWALDDVKLLAPSEPSKIVCVGRNYAEHAAELGNTTPKEPLIFLKPPSAIIAPEDAIVLTPLSERVDYEGELAVVMGKNCRQLKASDDVRPYILGFTCLNDVTARDLQKKDVQFTRAKGFDTFCPFGPWIETELDLGAARVETLVNGQKRQSAGVSEMVFAVDFLVRWISQVMTLAPGDVISTGTPSGVGPLSAGDVVEVSVNGIGTLRNKVAPPS